MKTATYRHSLQQIKSPLNYIGGKQKILDQILPLFPSEIGCFGDLFAGGCNVGINVTAESVICNDNLVYLIYLYKTFKMMPLNDILQHIYQRIETYDLSLTNETGYKALRSLYNSHKNPLDLFVLIAFSFNHQIRFNNSHEYNNPFGRARSSFNATMKQNLERFIHRLQIVNIGFCCQNFQDFDFNNLTSSDFVYCDPPYLITTGTYNDGKRGFTGWTAYEERLLLDLLDNLDQKNIKFALSNVLVHKGKTNEILSRWLERNADYSVSFIDANYANASYQTLARDKTASVEVLITNYKVKQKQTNNTLF